MKSTRPIHERLLRLFDGDGYEEFDQGKYVFVKQWNGNTKNWQVAIYPKANWSKSKSWKDNKKADQLHRQLDEEFKAIVQQ